LRDSFRTALGDALETWLRNQPLIWQSGSLAVTHAGADPGLPISEQPADTLLWGHPDFFSKPRRDAIWVAHGHTIMERPLAGWGRISLDTGGYRTGRISMARVEPDGRIGFLTVTDA
jgi:serine/threonine protein phosphatase 1